MTIKKLIFILMLFISVFVGLNNVSAAESDIESQIEQEVRYYISYQKLPVFHLQYYEDTGYQNIYWKIVHLSNDLEEFASLPESEIVKLCSWYDNKADETWDYIFDNLDIDPEYLEQDKYLGLYWDSQFLDYEKTSYLYLIWTSHYTPSEFNTILQLKESGKTYNIYDSEEDGKDLNANFEFSDHYHFKENDLTIHTTVIASIHDGVTNGIPLKQKYKFEGFTYGLDDYQYNHDLDVEEQFSGNITGVKEFDLGHKPKYDGRSAMQLVTHAYEIIDEAEVQSYYSFNFGGYVHQAVFNTKIDIDKIYRVDVGYTVTNDNKDWYQFWLKEDQHQITKSLTTERTQGGLFNLSTYQGFEEGSFQSTNSKATNYKYRLHLNYDENNWNIFSSAPYDEADYKRVSKFQILRMNYLVDGDTYDVDIKMDIIEGDSLNFFDKDLILDTTTLYYEIKENVDEFVRKLLAAKDLFKILIIIICTILGIALLAFIINKIIKFINYLKK